MHYLEEQLKKSDEYEMVNYSGKQRKCKVIEVPIELLQYRIENIRTINSQKEWLAKHPDESKDFFSANALSDAVQRTQHELLKKIVKKDKLVEYFTVKKDEAIHEQQHNLIVSDDGIVVNGNCRLCAWRELYYSNAQRYKHFQMIRVTVLPDHDPQHMYELEVALQLDEPEKQDYVWHAVAADCKQQLSLTGKLETVARNRNLTVKALNQLLGAYDAAEQYLESIGYPNEWSRVDQQQYAFQQYVQSMGNLIKPGEKELFRIIIEDVLSVPVQGERLYKVIPKIALHLTPIVDKIKDEFDIDIASSEEETQDDLDFLSGGDSVANDIVMAKTAQKIAEIDEPTKIVSIVQHVIETQDELAKEKKHGEYVFERVRKAATELNNAVSNMTPTMNRGGIEKQLDNIALACEALRDWIKQ